MKWSVVSIALMVAFAFVCVLVFIEVTGPMPESAIAKWARTN